MAIYESGTPSTAGLVLGSADYQELITRADYLRAIEESDSALADRVEQVRNEVRHEAKLVATLEARAVAYDRRLAAARSRIAAVRAAAEQASARLRALSSEREASLAGLKSSIAEWVTEIQGPAPPKHGRPAGPKPKPKSAAGSAAPTRSRPTS